VLYPATAEKIAADKKETEEAGVSFMVSDAAGERYSYSAAEMQALYDVLNNAAPGRGNAITPNATVWRETYTYDASGNRATKTTPWGTITYTYDAENRLRSMGQTQYAYDREGNLLSERGVRKTAQYGYNGASRMTLSAVTDLVAGSRTISHYAYDAFGRRTLMQDDGGEMMRSLYDGLSFDVLRESVTLTDGSFTTKFTTEAPKANEPTVSSDRYVWIGDDTGDGRTTQGSDGKTRSLHYTGMQVGLYAYGQSVAMNRSASGGSGNATRGGIAYFGSDVLGSVRSATDEYGSIEGRYEYDAFGKPYKGDFTTGLNAGYTGKPYDSVTGLYNYGYRDYKPETARFTTVDPIKDGSNWYAYVNNDAVNFVDERGLRGLTSEELAEAKKIFGDDYDYSSIEILTGDELPFIGKILTATDAAVTIGNTIYFPNEKDGSSEYDPDIYIDWLIHELTHAYQYQKDGYAYIPKSIIEQLTKGKDAYTINWDFTKEFDDYGIEEQAELVELYYEVLNKRNTLPNEKLEYLENLLRAKGVIPSEEENKCSK
jgi:RHS repeat-associated protein